MLSLSNALGLTPAWRTKLPQAVLGAAPQNEKQVGGLVGGPEVPKALVSGESASVYLGRQGSSQKRVDGRQGWGVGIAQEYRWGLLGTVG